VILPDVNVLIYAFRRDSAQHAACKPWLDTLVEGDAQFGLSPRVLCALVRITTNARIFREPSPLE
jgi:predicted nucleic acid-binding protein